MSRDTQEPISLEKDPYTYMQRVCFNRWKPYIIRAIDFDGLTRFNRFTKQIPITEKVLAANLRELEADGIITRTVYPEVPPRVEYRLTELGESLCALLDTVYKWGWAAMKQQGLPIDPLGEMWHGYHDRDEDMMNHPYKR